MTLPELLRKLDLHPLKPNAVVCSCRGDTAVAASISGIGAKVVKHYQLSLANCWCRIWAAHSLHILHSTWLAKFWPFARRGNSSKECCTILPNGGCGEAAHFLKSLSSPSLAALFNWFHWCTLISTVNTSSSQLFSILLNSFQLFSPLNSCQLSPILPSSPHLAFAALVSSCHLFTIFSNSSHLVSTSLTSSQLISPLLDSSHLFLPLLAISSSYDYPEPLPPCWEKNKRGQNNRCTRCTMPLGRSKLQAQRRCRRRRRMRRRSCWKMLQGIAALPKIT